MFDISDLDRFNSWWRTGRVNGKLLPDYRRKIFYEIEKGFVNRQIVLLWGLRRLGKTTVLLQCVDKILSEAPAKNVLYYSFDEEGVDLKEVLEAYQKMVLGKSFEESKERIYLLLDEIQKVDDWENKIKVYYDLYPNIKFFLSGSAAVGLKKGSKESLGGRVYEYVIRPLDFEEFLELSGKDPAEIKKNLPRWKKEILPDFYRYLKYGTFPEIVAEEDAEQAKKYIQSLVERIIYRDLPEELEIRDVELLRNLTILAARNPGMIVNYKEIGKDLGKDQRTIANYFQYMEFGLLISYVYNFRGGSSIASMRKMKKIYLTTPNIAFAYAHSTECVLPYLLENLIQMETEGKHFYRNGFEIDFILFKDEKIIAIEAKKQSRSIKQIKKFLKKYGEKTEKTMIVTYEEEGKTEETEVLPAWRFLLEKPYKN
ncbi:MAG: ATP-binding protein [Candidatus Altiarchaeia archaeon]